MLALSFKFATGRYHATPWDRHVNEGAVAWPPEPWSVLRALIATWHHKVKYVGEHRSTTLLELIQSLAGELPEYALPSATHSHTRHYMPQGKPGETSLVFDAFTAVAREEPLYVIWPTLDLPEDQTALLDALLDVIGYLGRAESWVEARREVSAPKANCVPGDDALDPETGELLGEMVSLYASLTPEKYTSLRNRFLLDSRAAKKLEPALPQNLLDALSVETSTLRKQGWSQPPAARKVHYLRAVDALRPKRIRQTIELPNFTTVRYLLIGKPLPRMEDSVHIGELLRRAVMSQVKEQYGEDAIPAVLSGHGLSMGNRHQHAFYLPQDTNGDGRIDRLCLHVPAGLGLPERRVLQKVRRIWRRGGGEWRLVLEYIGDASGGGALMGPASRWQSVTPYLHPWHAKKGFTVEDQVRRECRERGLPEPILLEQLEHIPVGKQYRRTVHFHRFRDKRGLTQPDRRGSFWQLAFEETVQGPLALGFGCHFGLGLFSPTE